MSNVYAISTRKNGKKYLYRLKSEKPDVVVYNYSDDYTKLEPLLFIYYYDEMIYPLKGKHELTSVLYITKEDIIKADDDESAILLLKLGEV